ncbi:RsmB/NOP family class I SAM-dependent RNA methyltransferase [Rubellimicrobium aerolatum]|uniref:RsmB/NOP family class I SAM-dependent RNA methyltransferase n=1 Tax=Rubellimicrobium aerolatum TaxID=490979 RepID=A0ABW0SGB8_9RHOB|nr:RsmB/NOP family class I SAM-dependent RNA methyltransferase [Rubellimicrobium aerolatum]MBP1806646.1 16S rRNA (cytosine967-C5)-methyltransferase [Rubellimicrobium aerolatum]
MARNGTGAARDGEDRAGLGPRRAAWRLLNAVTAEGMLLSDPRAAAILASLPPEGRARAQRLAVETLRNLSRIDGWLGPRLRKAPPPTVRNLLRLGALEIGQGEAPHGVGNALVALVAEGRRTEGFRGLVNAVMRHLGEEGPEAWARLGPPHLPDWLRGPLVEAWGGAAVRGIEAAHWAGVALDLSAKGDPARLAERLGGRLLPTGTVRLDGGAQVTALPGYQEGEFWVQDAAAALPARVLDPRPGDRVLDLCAAPGGKTLQLAAMGAEVTALDLSAPRLERLRDNLARTGLKARIVQGDVLEFDEGGWDAVLLDAPCSATGTIRRHPDLPQARDGAEIGGLIELQARMIDHALGLLRPGGRLVFATCSLLPDEGEAQVEAALERHAGLSVEVADAPGVEPAWRTELGLRTRPDHWADLGGLDGFFVGRLRTPG